MDNLNKFDNVKILKFVIFIRVGRFLNQNRIGIYDLLLMFHINT